MFIQLYMLLSVYSLVRLPKRRLNNYVVQQHPPALVVPPNSAATLQQAAVANATECLDSITAYIYDEHAVDAVDVPPLATLTGNIKDNIVFYVAEVRRQYAMLSDIVKKCWPAVIAFLHCVANAVSCHKQC